MKSIKDKDWIPVRKSNLKYYEDIDLYYQCKKSEKILLYKAAGLKFSEAYLADNPFTGDLYIKPEDKEKCLRKAQHGFSMELTQNIIRGGADRVKENLVNLVAETFNDSRVGGLGVMQETLETVVEGYSRQPQIIKNLARISYSDYTTTIHSINVMALTVGYCFFTNRDLNTTVRYGLAALFHDIGKTEIPVDILSSPRPLTDYEFQVMRNHPELGAEILQNDNPTVHTAIPGALEHHEKVDGSGYPRNLKKISEIGQILAIVDSYEALTNDDRLYRTASTPLGALKILKNEVEYRRLNPRIFVDFAYSLTDFSRGSERENYLKVISGWNLPTQVKADDFGSGGRVVDQDD